MANSFSKFVYYGEYKGRLRQLILDLKIRQKQIHIEPLSRFLCETLNNDKDLLSADVIVPVPSTKKYGFDAIGLLAKEVGEKVKKPVETDNLYRTKEVLLQAKLTAQERKKNVEGIFAVRDNNILSGKKVILLDDILTTGATANECSKTLLKAGAKEVLVLTLAKPILRKEKGGVSNMAIRFVGNVEKKVSKKGEEYLTGYIDLRIPVLGFAQKNNKNKINFSIDEQKLNWLLKNPAKKVAPETKK